MNSGFGLDNNLEYIEFEFDSSDCQQSYNQNYYTTDWPNFYMGKPLTNVAAIKILEAQIPATFYLFNNNNNSFYLQEWTTSGELSDEVVIPIGNYTVTNLPGILGGLLTLASPNDWSYTVTFDTLTNKLQVTNNSTQVDSYFQLRFGTGLYDPGHTNPRLWLGFSGGNNTSSQSTGVSGTSILAAPSVIQLGGPSYLYINSRAIGALVHLYLPGNGVVNRTGAGADGPQICKVPFTTPVGSVCNWQDPTPRMWFDVGNTTFSGSLDFYLTMGTETFEVPLELNGAAFSLKLGILTNQTNHNDFLGGGAQNKRMVQRTWPTGTY